MHSATSSEGPQLSAMRFERPAQEATKPQAKQKARSGLCYSLAIRLYRSCYSGPLKCGTWALTREWALARDTTVVQYWSYASLYHHDQHVQCHVLTCSYVSTTGLSKDYNV